MTTVTLRPVGGSLMVTLPKQLAEAAGLEAGSKLDVVLDAERRFVLTPQRRRRYTLDELMQRCRLDGPPSEDERGWIDAPQVGDEGI